MQLQRKQVERHAYSQFLPVGELPNLLLNFPTFSLRLVKISSPQGISTRASIANHPYCLSECDTLLSEVPSAVKFSSYKLGVKWRETTCRSIQEDIAGDVLRDKRVSARIVGKRRRRPAGSEEQAEEEGLERRCSRVEEPCRATQNRSVIAETNACRPSFSRYRVNG